MTARDPSTCVPADTVVSCARLRELRAVRELRGARERVERPLAEPHPCLARVSVLRRPPREDVVRIPPRGLLALGRRGDERHAAAVGERRKRRLLPPAVGGEQVLQLAVRERRLLADVKLGVRHLTRVRDARDLFAVVAHRRALERRAALDERHRDEEEGRRARDAHVHAVAAVRRRHERAHRHDERVRRRHQLRRAGDLHVRLAERRAAHAVEGHRGADGPQLPAQQRREKNFMETCVNEDIEV